MGRFIGLLLAIIFTSKGCHSESLVCGRAPLNTKTVGDASPGSWPWMASISYNDNYHICAGSLITDQWVLTAAHCIGPWFDNATIKTHLGQHNYSDPNSNQESRKVVDISCHPLYNPLSYQNDICLLKLETPVSFTPYIQPVCIAAQGSIFHSGVDSWVAGWGVVATGGHTYPTTLQEVFLPIVGTKECTCLNTYIPKNTLCAGNKAGGSDLCQGDSGSPLVVKQLSAWVQAGLMSFGEGCKRPDKPGVYTEVSEYQDWITSVINRDTLPGFVNFTSTGVDSDAAFVCPTATTATTDSTTLDCPYGSCGRDVPDSGENRSPHLLSLCGFALSLFVLG